MAELAQVLLPTPNRGEVIAGAFPRCAVVMQPVDRTEVLVEPFLGLW